MMCVFQIYFQMITSVNNCCLYLGLSDYPIIVTEQLKERLKDKNLFFAYVGQLLSSANPGANHLFLTTLIGAKWHEVKTAPGSCYFFQRKELEHSEEVESLKAHLEAIKVGWYTEPSLPNNWKVRRVLGEGKLVFRSPQMHILKSNKALLDYISNHEMSKEDVRKI